MIFRNRRDHRELRRERPDRRHDGHRPKSKMMRPFIESELTAFEDYLNERQSIAERRAAGNPQPWTDNAILRNKHFCNVVSDDDRTSRDARHFLASGLGAARPFNVVPPCQSCGDTSCRHKTKARDAREVEAVLVRLPACFNSQAYRINVEGGLWHKPQIARMIARAYPYHTER